MEVNAERTISGRATEELGRLFNLYRISRLNVLYYGKRASTFMNLQRWWLVGVAVLSATALALLLAPEMAYSKSAAVICASLAGVAAAVLPSLGWSECARDLHFLHVAYGMLFGQIELVMVKIKKRADLTPELEGEAQALYETFSRLEPMDEKFPDRRIVADLNKLVLTQFPPDYIWNSL